MCIIEMGVSPDPPRTCPKRVGESSKMTRMGRRKIPDGGGGTGLGISVYPQGPASLLGNSNPSGDPYSFGAG